MSKKDKKNKTYKKDEILSDESSRSLKKNLEDEKLMMDLKQNAVLTDLDKKRIKNDEINELK